MYEGKTALHVAIEEGSPTAVKLLLEYNANMELQVMVTLSLALCSVNVIIWSFLSFYMYVQDKSGEKPLHSCAFV